MTRKIILILLLALVSCLTTACSTAQEPPIPKKQQPLPEYIVRQQNKVNEIKRTKEGQEIFRLVDVYSNKYKVDSNLVHAVILMESGYDSKATSSSNAQGLMQLMPVHKGKVEGCTNLYNKRCNIETGVKHLGGLMARHDGNVQHALASYNAGGGAVDRSLKKTGKIPPYTKHYVNRVLEYRRSMVF